jgi:hypothetical protein
MIKRKGKRTDNTMANRKGKRTDNTMAKRKGKRTDNTITKTLIDGQIGKVLISSIAWLGGVYSCILLKKKHIEKMILF